MKICIKGGKELSDYLGKHEKFVGVFGSVSYVYYYPKENGLWGISGKPIGMVITLEEYINNDLALENWLRSKLDEIEGNHEYSISTDTVKALIDIYNTSIKKIS